MDQQHLPAAGAAAPAAWATGPTFKIACVVAILIWGGNWPVMKIGASYMPPRWMAAARFTTACLVSFALVAALGRLRLPQRHEWPVVLGVGLLQMALFSALVTVALTFVLPGRASLIAYATSIWVVPGAAFLLKEKLTRVQIASALCGYAGIAVVTAPALLHADERSAVGIALLLAASLAWALNILQIKATPRVKLDLTLLPWQTLVASIPLLVLAPLVDGRPHFLGDAHAWAVVAFAGPLATALTFLIVLRMTQQLPPVTVSVCMLAVPVVGLLTSRVVFGESLSWDLIAGIALLLVGLTLPLVARLSGQAPRTIRRMWRGGYATPLPRWMRSSKAGVLHPGASPAKAAS